MLGLGIGELHELGVGKEQGLNKGKLAGAQEPDCPCSKSKLSCLAHSYRWVTSGHCKWVCRWYPQLGVVERMGFIHTCAVFADGTGVRDTLWMQLGKRGGGRSLGCRQKRERKQACRVTRFLFHFPQSLIDF